MTNLNDILGEYTSIGFSLKETGDHVLELRFKDRVIARLNQTRATPEIILEGCRNYTANLAKQAHGV